MTIDLNTVKKNTPLAKITNFLSMIIAVVALLIGGRLLYINTQQHELLVEFENKITQQQTQLEKTNTQLNAQTQQVATLKTTVDEMAGQLNQNKQADALHRYRLANIERFVRLANQVLLLEYDASKAQHLLQNANQEITELNDPALHDVQEQVASDIAALKATPVINTGDLYTQLNALIDQAEKLPVTPTLKFVPTQNSADPSQPPSTMGNVLNWLNQYIKIQKHSDIATPLLTPEEVTLVKHNIVVLLEQAQWAVLRRQTLAYQTSLTRAQKLVSQYGVKDDAAVKAFLDSVTQLQTIDISPTLPDISKSLPLLQKITGSDMP